MVLHDLCCARCESVAINSPVDPDRLPPCPRCGQTMEIEWNTPRLGQLTTVHPRERSIVWRHPQTGKVAYPGRNDVPMPERYRRAGYERHEFTSLKALDRFCKDRKLINEAANFDKSGHADDL